MVFFSDNGILVQSRFMLMEGMLLFFMCLSMYSYLKFRNLAHRYWSPGCCSSLFCLYIAQLGWRVLWQLLLLIMTSCFKSKWNYPNCDIFLSEYEQFVQIIKLYYQILIPMQGVLFFMNDSHYQSSLSVSFQGVLCAVVILAQPYRCFFHLYSQVRLYMCNVPVCVQLQYFSYLSINCGR